MPVWGDFEVDLQNVIGRGGMSTVYSGRQVSLNRRVAIKVLKGDLIDESPEFIQRFHREAELLARLVDEHIVQIYGAGQMAGLYYYAMEFVEGEDLAKRLKKGEPFPEERVLEIGQSVCRALEVAWEHKIIHRDIKPSNITITSTGKTKVMDFGLAKNIDQSQTRSDLIMGTPRYVSPEQAVGNPCDVRSDLYSLGVVLYELSTGKPPFDAPDVSPLLYKHIYETPQSPRELKPELSDGFALVILRLMQKDPANRFQSPTELRVELDRLAAGQSVSDRTISAVKASVKPKSSSPRVLILLATIAILAAALYLQWDALRPLLAGWGLGEPPVAVSTLPPSPPPKTDSTTPPPPPPPPAIRDPKVEAEEAQFKKQCLEGNEALAKQAWDEAVAKFTSALTYSKISPDAEKEIRGKIDECRFRAAMDRGQKALEQEKIDQAIEDFKLAWQLRPKEAEAKLRHAECEKILRGARELEQASQWDLAAKQYSAALEFADKKELIERYRDMCLTVDGGLQALKSKDYKKALENFKQALRFGRYDAAIQALIKQTQEAIANEEAVHERERQKQWEGHVRQGEEAFKAGRWRDALAAFEKAAAMPYSTEKFHPLLERCKRALRAPPDMVYVPDGECVIGTHEGREYERPEHKSSTGEFYIDAREVTQGQYAKFLAEFKDHTRCHPKEPRNKDHTPLRWEDQKDAARSVYGVDWFDAYAYLAHTGKRLPTEQEFEKAAGWDTLRERKNLYPWGNVYQKEGGPSFFGCEDMGSGLLEWTSSTFMPYPGSTARSPFFGERYHTVRGGVDISSEAKENVRTFSRFYSTPTSRSLKIGFRGASDVSP